MVFSSRGRTRFGLRSCKLSLRGVCTLFIVAFAGVTLALPLHKVNAAPQITGYSTTSNANIRSEANGLDGSIWFVENFNGRVGHIRNGILSEVFTGNNYTNSNIVTATDGTLYYGYAGGPDVRLGTTSEDGTSYGSVPIPLGANETTQSVPQIVSDRNNNIWMNILVFNTSTQTSSEAIVRYH